jgi:hypothetical protein
LEHHSGGVIYDRNMFKVHATGLTLPMLVMNLGMPIMSDLDILNHMLVILNHLS